MTTKGDRYIRWIEEHIIVPEGKDVGKPLRLRPFQKNIIKGIYDSDPQIRYAIISMPRKNAKTALSGMLLLLNLCGPAARRNSQLYSTGLSKEQAAIIFELCAKMVRANPALLTVCNIKDSAKEIHCHELGTSYKALAAEANKAHGRSPCFTVHDELGQVTSPTSALYEAIESGDMAHDSPLSIIISTQAPNDSALLSTLIDDTIRTSNNPLSRPVVSGDGETKLWFWTADEEGHESDPEWAFSEAALRDANPAYGDFVSKKSLLSKAAKAQRMPSTEASFRNLNLNQRVEATNPYISQAVWRANDGMPDISLLEGNVWCGLDLSARQDLTALSYVAVDAEGVYHVWAEFFVPSLGLVERSRRDRVQYDVWAKQGFITTVPGASVDYRYPAQRLLEICAASNVVSVAYDRWRMDYFKKELAVLLGIDVDAEDLGERVQEVVPLRSYGQGYRDMTPALDIMEAALLNQKVLHGGNPVLTMCAANARATMDPAGGRKLDKIKSTGRIDGIQALAMAFGACGSIVSAGKGPSVYETRGVLEI